jgi:RimJ/RimL family protein N-acetyltransferase
VAHFLQVIKSNPNIFKYISFPPMDTEEDFRNNFYDDLSRSPAECLYVIFDKAMASGNDDVGSNYAGIICLSATSTVNAVTEIGVIVFPAFQRTHVATNAIGLILLWALDPPSAGGVGLRRVEWKSNAANSCSRKTASRMGFEFEGINRWQRVDPRSMVALPIEALEKRNGTKGELPGRHTAVYSIVWDEWDEKRPNVIAQMVRKR